MQSHEHAFVWNMLSLISMNMLTWMPYFLYLKHNNMLV